MPSELLFSRLNLKVRAFIIFLCNLYPVLRKYNKISIIITDLRRRSIEVYILGKKFADQLCFILKI